MSLDRLLHQAINSSDPLDEAAQHALLALAATPVAASMLVSRDDAAPSLLARVVDTADGDLVLSPVVRTAALHPSCPLEAVERLADRSNRTLSYLAVRADLPRRIGLQLLEHANRETTARLAERDCMQADDVPPFLDRLLDVEPEDDFDLENDKGQEHILAGIRTLADRFPAAVGRYATARAEAKKPPYATQMLLHPAVTDTLEDGDRDTLARQLIIDPLARVAARAGAQVPDALHDLIYNHLELLTAAHRTEIADLLRQIDLSRCGRREWLCATFLPPADDSWLEGVDNTEQLAAKVTGYVPETLATAILTSPLCTSQIAIATLNNDGRSTRAKMALAARPGDDAMVEHIVAKFPTLVEQAAAASGRDVVELVSVGLDRLVPAGPSPQLDQATKAWARLLTAEEARLLPLAHLSLLAGSETGDALNVGIRDALVRLGQDPLAADTARTLAAGWEGTFDELADAVAGLRPHAPTETGSGR